MHITPLQEHYFADARSALEAIAVYAERLRLISQRQRHHGLEPTDQSYPVEVFALRPSAPTAPPLVLLGGMGPVVGADGFATACARFGDRREIVLFQACTVPCRTSVILRGGATGHAGSQEREALLDVLLRSVTAAAGYLRSSTEEAVLIILCNTAHAFLAELVARIEQQAPELAARLRIVSLVESAVTALKHRRFNRVLALATTGTRVGRIYSQRLEEEGIAYLEPRQALDGALMRSIMGGVKALNDTVCREAGASFFRELLESQRLETGPAVDAVLAGCTEIPRMLLSVRECGEDRVLRFLERLAIVDPYEAALAAA